MVIMIMSIPFFVYAHPGRTEASGGHRVSSTGGYHYHHGYSAHQHSDMDNDGDLDCPYNFIDKTDYSLDVSSKKNSETSNLSSNRIEKNKGVPEWALNIIIVLGMAVVFIGIVIYRHRVSHLQNRKNKIQKWRTSHFICIIRRNVVINPLLLMTREMR